MERKNSDIKLKQKRWSMSSEKSFRSIDQFKLEKSPFQSYGKQNRFPFKPIINFLIILFTTVQVTVVVSSRIYLRSQLIHTFLSVYLDDGIYTDIFNGKQFFLQITNVTELKTHFEYLFNRVNVIDDDSFVDFFYKDAKFLLHTQYKQFAGNEHRKNIHEINPKKGILQPFNMSNVTDIQWYLLQVNSFQLQIQNLTMKQNWYGFKQKYTHQITYYFIDNIKMQVNFNFRIINAMVREDTHLQNQANFKLKDCMDGDCYYHPKPEENLGGDHDDQNLYQIIYIVRIRTFFGFVLLLSLISLYFNYVAIKRTYKILYEQLTAQQEIILQRPEKGHEHSIIGQQQQFYIRQNIRKWVQSNEMTVTEIKFEHYFHLLEFDLIFSTLSNIFQIITAFYLVNGIQRQRLAGVTCLFAWMTIFKFIRNYQNLAIMYQLIKLSFVKVIFFFFEFLPVFISYTLLGLCLFPKVSFFSSIANSVTTLVGIMMGDSIQMITYAILEKNSLILGVVYIFSFVLLFMHAIHNTLTSLIKQFFILKKIQLVKKQKQRNKDQNYIYIQQMRPHAQQQKKKLPLKLKVDLMRGLLRVKALKRTNKFKEIISFIYKQLQSIRMTEKWLIQEDQLSKYASVKQQLVRRALKITETLKKLDTVISPFATQSFQTDFMSVTEFRSSSTLENKQSVLTEQKK